MPNVRMPDGTVVSFPEGTPTDQIQSSLQRFQSGAAQQSQGAQEPTQPTPMREQMFRSLETGLPLATSLVGGAMGGAAGLAGGPAAPATAPAGAVAGVGLGAALGQSAVEALRPFMTGEMPTFTEAMGRSAETGALFAAFEGGGRVLGKGLQAAGQRMRNIFLPKQVPPEIVRAHETLVKRGSSLTPAQLTGEEATILDIAEQVSQSAFFGQRIFSRRFKEQKEALGALADEIVTGLEGRLSNENLGNLVQMEVTKRSDLTREVASSVYDRVFMQAPNALAPVDDLLAASREVSPKVLRRLEALLNRPLSEAAEGVAIRRESFSDGSPVGVMSALTGKAKDQFMPLADAHKLRSRLLEIGRRDTTGMNQIDIEIVNLAKKLSGKLTDTLLNTDRVVGLPEETQALYRTASTLTSGAAEAFQNEFIRSATKKLLASPGQIAPLVLQPDSAQALAKWRTAVGPEMFQQIQDRAGAALIRRASSGSAEGGMGQVNGQQLLDRINQLGEETVNALFTREAVEVTEKGRRASRLAEGKPATVTRRVTREKEKPVFDALTELGNALVQAKERAAGSGGMWMQLAQAGAAGVIGSGILSSDTSTSSGELAGAGAIILAPPMIGRMLLSPTAMKWLTKGLQSGPGTPEWAKATEEIANLSRPTFTAPATAAAVNVAGEESQPSPAPSPSPSP